MRLRRVLIANRGEIAVRIARTLRELGIEPIAVYSDPDRTAPHVRACDRAFNIGPGPARESYLRTDAILDAAKRSGADAIHPGYGFMSENAAFAEAVEKAGIVFIGPPAEAMRIMGSKTGARQAMQAAGVPVVPGTPKLHNADEALAAARDMTFPVMIKAAAGGGGKGMRLVETEAKLAAAFRGAQSEALSAFGDDSVYMEKAIYQPRHIEMQIFAGPDGRAVWLGERECSMQRRHQKIIEETPSPLVDDAMRADMGALACKAAEAVNYRGAGTIEFLASNDRRFYFLEMNTRLQVEHPVTELCCGTDLVAAQIAVAQGEPLPWRQEDIRRRGHAIEARIYAEDPTKGFLPSPGRIVDVAFPEGPGVRVDSGIAPGFDVPRFYDPMIAKVAVWGENRELARRRLIRALGEIAIKGIKTNTLFLRELLEHSAFCGGAYHTGTVAEVVAHKRPPIPADVLDVAIAAAVVRTYQNDQRGMAQSGGTKASAWRTPTWRMRGG